MLMDERDLGHQTGELLTEVGIWEEKYRVKEREKEKQDQEIVTLTTSLEKGELIEDDIGDTESLFVKLKQRIVETQKEISALK